MPFCFDQCEHTLRIVGLLKVNEAFVFPACSRHTLLVSDSFNEAAWRHMEMDFGETCEILLNVRNKRRNTIKYINLTPFNTVCVNDNYCFITTRIRRLWEVNIFRLLFLCPHKGPFPGHHWIWSQSHPLPCLSNAIWDSAWALSPRRIWSFLFPQCNIMMEE